MKSILAALLLAAGSAGAASAEQRLNGAGATFPFPIYSKWFDAYNKKTGVKINYQAIGSGGGIRQVTKKTVDFGASDGPMTDKQMYQIDGKIHHIPTVLGGVVPAFNLKDAEGNKVSDLKLTGKVLADIFLGKITNWDDPEIADLNPGVGLPGNPIIVIRRADGSGTTYAFTDYLSQVSKDWKKTVGRNTSVQWPVGLGGKGNPGVAALVVQTPNSIGYLEAIYAIQNDLPYASMKNKAGEFVKASIASVNAAAAGSANSMPKDFRVSIADADGRGAYPISTYTWLLVYEKNRDGKGELIRNFLEWMVEDGQALAPELGYSQLPGPVRAMVKETIKKVK
ncbi:MAG: phosphate ABC transporter substrate-binding protein PstS [Elusimicrobia bacterium CG_4_9_14_3_um_filter_62_55]|nr:MAG: phosphate ABC transporter substrate-binding protein PstS [Elusimicrobia bacterium CG22_combo_CG10-13_8_21_14_all_63_91]PJA14880.1 MAG: phosphate ABC transporter substrate-binding protein PstS [Elusimicrobia bacterium CG_4_10_14_0_2_um_filter_63_34]PJB26714.1 MAG: phosphate ABC transporter substrate-binding protein PstS [Elusimicrobia bacterium CG_4_9_14_3_um_filter_62_55]